MGDNQWALPGTGKEKKNNKQNKKKKEKIDEHITCTTMMFGLIAIIRKLLSSNWIGWNMDDYSLYLRKLHVIEWYLVLFQFTYGNRLTNRVGQKSLPYYSFISFSF